MGNYFSGLSIIWQLLISCLVIILATATLLSHDLFQFPEIRTMTTAEYLDLATLFLCLIAIILALVAIYLTGRRTIREINQLNTFADNIRQENYDYRLPAGESLEVKKFSNTLRDMIIKIIQLTAFPGNNPQPVISADLSGRIIYQNPAVTSFLKDLNLDKINDLLPSSHTQLISICNATGQSYRKIEYWVNDRVFSWDYHCLHDQGVVHIYGDEITAHKQLEEQLSHDAFHDPLTQIPNRLLLSERIDQALKRWRNNKDDSFAVLILDLDHFKLINDSLGPQAGDHLLIEISHRLKRIIHRGDTLARLGGDEFALLIEEVGLRQAIQVAMRIKSSFDQSFKIDGHELNLTCSIGINIRGSEKDNSSDILRNADTAMYKAKARGGNCHEIFDISMHKDAMSRLEMEIALKQALKRDEFIVYYQPILALASGSITGFEALVRWQHPDKGLVPPGSFIPLTEESGLIIPLGQYILEKACNQLKKWQEIVPGCEKLMISINVAPKQLSHTKLLDDIEQALVMSRLDPAHVKLEITENGVMENIEENRELLSLLKERQISLGIDDFGTGYSSLSHLHRFPFDTLKIDRSFVMQMEQGDENMEIIKTIISLADSLGKKVIAEGIETESHLDVLRRLQCGYGQGYYFSKPLPAEEAEELLRSHSAGIESWTITPDPASPQNLQPQGQAD